MFLKGNFTINSTYDFREKIASWLKSYNTFCFLDSNSDTLIKHPFSYPEFDFIIAAGIDSEISSINNSSLKDFDDLLNSQPDWYFGFFSYDVKNRFENLYSKNIDHLNWPDFYFFRPLVLILVKNNYVEIQTSAKSTLLPGQVWEKIVNTAPLNKKLFFPKPEIKSRLTKDEYHKKINHIKERIHRGDLYEINFCQEYFTHTPFDPFWGFLKLSAISPTPFSAFFRLDKKYLLSASPERFLKKQGQKLISQPIKGTTRRGSTKEEDCKFADQLKNSPKERSENIMIVDLVRNDLSRISIKDSVKVEELCGIYSFQQVHQMISTISSTSSTNSIEEIIKSTFPMGSMTGAPKIKAMQLSEELETTKRGLYSGALGYISPEKDFDFNVVIRSLQYNSENEYLSYLVGGAITSLSDAEKEYEECLVKASAIEQVLNNE
jgi:para-aminobenzoate synthetase component 1